MSFALIRVEASKQAGLGHLSRGLALAEQLECAGTHCTFALRETHGLVDPASQGHATVVLPDRESGPDGRLALEEAQQLSRIADRIGAAWVVVDHYEAGEDYLETIRGPNRRLALIDDFQDRPARPADLVVNPNPGARAEPYRLRPGARALLGPRYAPIRAVFGRLRDRSLARRGGPLRRVLVVMGGTDSRDLTAAVVRGLLAALPGDVEVRAVMGPLATGADALDRIDDVRLQRLGPLDPADLAQEMLQAQAAVATPSTVCWEMATLGLPLVLVRVAGNQMQAAGELERRGIARVFGVGEDPARAFTAGDGLLLESVRQRMSRAAARLTRGAGAALVAGAMRTYPTPLFHGPPG